MKAVCDSEEKIKFLMLIAIITYFFTIVFSGTVFPASINNMEMIAENKFLSLYIDKNTTQIAVYDKINDKYFSTNPSSKRISGELASQFIINYDRGAREISSDNYSDSVELNQFEITQLDNGIRIDYKINEMWQTEDYLPELISKDQMKTNILDKITEDERNQLLERYILFEIVENENIPRVSIPGLEARDINKKEIFGNYTLLPVDKKEDLTQIQELQKEIENLEKKIINIKDNGEDNEKLADLEQKKEQVDSELQNIKRDFKDYKQEIIWALLQKLADFRVDYERIGFDEITKEHISPFIDNQVYLLKESPPFVIQDLAEITHKAGYTAKNTRRDHLENNINPPSPNIEVFEIPLKYILEEDNLIVKIPLEQIHYPENVRDESGGFQSFPLRSITLLPFFGAAGTNAEGYIFVPDGSGALIELNQTDLESPVYQNVIYGRDYALDPVSRKPVMDQQLHLPVFGLKQEEKAFMGIIEEGEALATIMADVAGRRTDYNTVFPEFEIISKGRMGTEQMGHVDIYQDHPYQGDIKVRYAFLGENKANYVDMANYYRQYLTKKYSLKPERNQKIPFYLELMGAIPRQEPIMGVSRTVLYPLTNYQQAQLIIEELMNDDIENIQLRYSGLLSGGLAAHDYPERASFEKSLGKEKDFENLLKFLEEKNIDIFPEVNFMNINNKLFDSFSPRKDAAKLLDGSTAEAYDFDRVTRQRIENNKYVLSPRILNPLIENFLESYRQYQINGISLTNMGLQVNSDFEDNNGNFVDRQQAVTIIQEGIEKIKERELNTMVTGGNANVLPYIDNIVNIPLDSNNHWMITDSIPFFQIAIRGLANYTGKPLNFASDLRKAVLRTLETGAGLYFKWSYADSAEIKEKDYDNLYTLNYQEWYDTAIEVYQEVYPVLEQIKGKSITNHQKLKSNVYQTTFGEENKIIVIVNYNQESVEVNGENIEGKDFWVEGVTY